MARKRLTPVATPAADSPSPALAQMTHPGGAPETKAFGLASHVRRAPPIARVAGETAAEAALATLSAEVAQARAEGRMIVALELGEVAEDHLMRDRVDIDEGEMQVLVGSIADRGQQTAIEVVDLGADRADEPAGRRYGLISGWRRLMALRRLHETTGEARFATVKALVRAPESASDAYRAMVDENEIRVGLSYWERARIAVQAAEAGIYPSVQHALRDLFAAASRAKRSKIGSFVGIYQALGDSLRFPTALPERLGLQLAKALEEDADLAEALPRWLAQAAPADAVSEQGWITDALALRKEQRAESAQERAQEGRGASFGTPGAEAPKPLSEPLSVALRRRGRRLVLEGPGVDDALEADLAAWLAART